MKPNTLPKITEAEFQSQIIELARLYHWRLVHFRPARTNRGWRTAYEGDDGWPDLILARRDGRGSAKLLALECKSDRGVASPEQIEWLNVLGAVPGCTARVVHPVDWAWVVMQLTGA